MGAPQPVAPQPAVIPSAPQAQNAATQQNPTPLVLPVAQQAGGGELPYQPQSLLASGLLAAALFVIFGTGIWCFYNKSGVPLGYTSGGAAAAVGILIVLALVLRYPTLIMDDAPAAGGEPSTMRIMSLAIVLTFCLIMLRTGWNSGTLPSLSGQSEWVWLVTAALGGKAVQKFAEVQGKK
jgi:hypothetical protein